MKINDKIRETIPLICDSEKDNLDLKKKWDINYQYRLIFTNGRISELNPLNTFLTANLKHNDTIILLFPEKISFSEVLKSTYIQVSKNITNSSWKVKTLSLTKQVETSTRW